MNLPNMSFANNSNDNIMQPFLFFVYFRKENKDELYHQ